MNQPSKAPTATGGPGLQRQVAGQDSAGRCGAGVFDGTPPGNLTQVCRRWGPRIPRGGLRPSGEALHGHLVSKTHTR
jgi:hypothetical protein